jgi:microcystin-dependent protein
MSEPFLAEVKIVGFTFAPRGWALCDGQILPINQNQSLYSLLGTVYGGDGRTDFALPDMRGRVPIHVGENHPQGQKAGEETHTLTEPEMPEHQHTFRVATATATHGRAIEPTDPNAADFVLARANFDMYRAANQQNEVELKQPEKIPNAGGNQSHETMQPYLAVNFCIALQGLFPSRN